MFTLTVIIQSCHRPSSSVDVPLKGLKPLYILTTITTTIDEPIWKLRKADAEWKWGGREQETFDSL